MSAEQQSHVGVTAGDLVGGRTVGKRSTSSCATSALGQPHLHSDKYRSYVLGLLFVVYTCSLLDRMIISVLQESIKKDLGLTDTQLGVLTGFGFALFFATLGIPIARWADRSVRSRIIVISLCLWSLMTALSGFARTFAALLLFRIGVSVGEAGCTPASHSMISDYFARERRGTAISIYSLGGPLGVLIGLVTAGWLNQIVGWRQAFMIVGAPGLLVALVVHFTLREPPRGLSDGYAAHNDSRIALNETARVMWTCAPFRNLTLGYTVLSIASNAIVNWDPAFYSRTHGLGSGQIGTRLALFYALPLAVGTVTGGSLGDRLARRDVRWYLFLPALVVFLALPMTLGQYNVSSAAVSFALSVGPAFAIGMYLGPCFGVAQMLVPVSMRAMASAVLLLLASIVGVGLGPLITGVLSDIFRAQGYGVDSLGRALTLVSLFLVPGGVFLLLAARRLPLSLAGYTAER